MVYSKVSCMYGIPLYNLEAAEIFGVDFDPEDKTKICDDVNIKLRTLYPDHNVKLVHWPCCYRNDISTEGSPELFFGCEVNTIETDNVGEMFTMIAINGIKKGTKKYFFW